MLAFPYADPERLPGVQGESRALLYCVLDASAGEQCVLSPPALSPAVWNLVTVALYSAASNGNATAPGIAPHVDLYLNHELIPLHFSARFPPPFTSAVVTFGGSATGTCMMRAARY